MKSDFEETQLPPVTWYIGDVVEDNGELKLEWTDPKHGRFLYTEENLAEFERSSRDMLINRHEEVEPEWTIEAHARWRDLHYNAEYGLEKLQLEKRERGIALNLDFRPVVR